jgi:hypothetical protein
MDPIERLRDIIAMQDEHSHVGPAARERIRAIIIDAGENADALVVGRLIVERLERDELAQLVADWVEAQAAISPSGG